MKRLPDLAMAECVRELRASCRLPIDEAALDTMLAPLRPNFERILGHPDGARRWSDHGQRMRDNGRHLGALADFFASSTDSPSIGTDALTRAFQMVRAECAVRAERRPVAWEYCRPLSPEGPEPEEVLQRLTPVPEPV